MNESELQMIAEFVAEKSGIILNNSKAYLIESRLAEVVNEGGFADVASLARGLRRANRNVQESVVDALTTNETFFFRDKRPFQLFEETILPNLLERRQNASSLRIWCAAASTGQEPYSLAMLLLKHKQKLGHKRVKIFASDISESSLARAREGLYTQFEVQRGLPVNMLMEHFEQEGTSWRISDKLKSMVEFAQINLMQPFTHLGKFDAVYCRNVLIYFDGPTKRKVLQSVRNCMANDGYLVMGAAETMMGHSEEFERADGQRGLYQPLETSALSRLRA